MLKNSLFEIRVLTAGKLVMSYVMPAEQVCILAYGNFLIIKTPYPDFIKCEFEFDNDTDAHAISREILRGKQHFVFMRDADNKKFKEWC